MLDYRFKPISKVCAKTGAPLIPGAVCYSVLVIKDGEFERLDFSEAGWQGLPSEAVGYWQCIVPTPAPRQAATTDAETLLRYFEQLIEAANPQQEKLAYVLALFLLQKRRLKLDGSRVDDEGEFLQLSGSRGEGPYEVRDQQLSSEEMAALRQALDQQLTTSWEAA
ncbi:hypothetical protein [Planctomicrobium sp. SH664]|uniref:hypothetical protein n=1 Tax=Planctomicrobium sp. SH664 TaxID=3448125 RepID=UPI003F5C672C